MIERRSAEEWLAETQGAQLEHMLTQLQWVTNATL
jgi:hypothetical protein